jgi:hypothetical protein
MGECAVSSCNGRLCVATLSHQNLKLVMDYSSTRYLAKYVAVVDENNRVYVGASPKDPNRVTIHSEFLHNTKITNSAINKRNKLAKHKDANHPRERAISRMEIIMVMLGYEQVYTTFKFCQLPTWFLEERLATVGRAPITKMDPQKVQPLVLPLILLEDLNSGKVIPSYRIRNE